MIPELGLFCLVCAVAFSILLVVIPFLGLKNQRVVWMEAAHYYVGLQALCVALAFLK